MQFPVQLLVTFHFSAHFPPVTLHSTSKQFNDLKNEWKNTGSAGRKTDNKLWEKFNKSADRFFTAKKEVIESEITKVNELLAQLKDGQISTNEANDEIQALKNINKSKELDQLKKEIISIKQKKTKEQQILKILCILPKKICKQSLNWHLAGRVDQHRH